MAWRNIQLATLINIPQSTITDFSLCDLSSVPNANTMPNYVTWNGIEGSSISTGKFFGDNSEYCEITKPQAALIFKFYRNATDIGISQSQTVGSNLISFVAAVDDDTGKAYFLVLYKDSRYSWIGSGSGNRPPFGSSTQADMYYILTHNEYHAHTWRSFSSVTGKNGTFNFTMLKDEVIDDTQAQNLLTPDDFTRISSQTNAWNLLSGIPYMQEVYPIYAGKVDHMGIRYGLGGVAPDNYIIITVEFFTSASTPFLTQQIQTPKDLSENIYPAFIVDDENQVARMTLVREYTYAGFKRYNLNFSAMADSAQLYTWLHSHSEDPDVNEPIPDGEVEPWNDIGITGLTQPSVSAIDTGFTSMFKVSPTELKALAGFLWTDNFVENVAKFFSDPREIIIGLSLLPVEPPAEQSASEIKAGGISTGIFGFKLTSQYDLVEMGSIYIKEEKTAKFLNYPPNTRIIAHLPYVGDHELDVNDITGKTITLTYLFDFLNGCCIAELKVEGGDSGTHRYFYSGSCAVQIPTSSEDFGRQYSSILSSGIAFGSVLATPLTGGLSAPMGLGAIGNIVNNGMAMSPNADYSSGGGAITGFLSSQTAYLIIISPREKIAESQKQFIGRPSFMKKTLNTLSGFVKCYNTHLTSLPATGNEKDEIERALKDGVLIETGSPTPSVTPATSGNIVIAFMKMTSENNVIGKSWTRGTDENAILKIEGKLLYDQSILTPKILVEGDLRGFNYCYMSIFGRFYYITDIIARNGNLMEVSLKCDPLQSFKTEILACDAIIERTSDSNAINSYFNDNEYWCQMNKQVKFIPFLNGQNEELTLPRNKNSYILTIAGGD